MQNKIWKKKQFSIISVIGFAYLERRRRYTVTKTGIEERKKRSWQKFHKKTFKIILFILQHILLLIYYDGKAAECVSICCCTLSKCSSCHKLFFVKKK